jgi:hypothetical protein
MERTTGLIDASEEFPEAARALHIAYYIPVNWGIQDRISRSLVDFQHARDPQAMQWVRLTALLAEQVLSCDVIVRALSSKEKTAGGGEPLDRVCQELARRMDVPYAPERLRKTRQTQAVKNAGGRRTRMKHLLDAYTFDAAGLSETPRVLIVDDVITTGATLSAIASAIRKTSPASEILFLGLARTEPHLTRFHLEDALTPVPDITIDLLKVNAHLDERYFFGTTSPVAFKPRPIMPPARTPPSVPKAAPAPVVAVSSEPRVPPATPEIPTVKPEPVLTFEEAPEHHREPQGEPALQGRETHVDARPFVRSAVQPQAAFKKLGLIATGLALTAVLVIALFLVRPQGEEPAPGRKAVREESTAINSPAVNPAKPDIQPPQAPKVPTRRRMEIALPNVGLRSSPNFDAPPLSINLTEGEKVTILERYVAVSGPNWVRVRTEGGKKGWLFAGAVRVDTTKSAAKGMVP